MVKIIYVVGDREICVDAPVGSVVMENAVKNGVEGILAECGGACVCATCHVIVDPSWFERLPPVQDTEAVMLDYVPDPQPTSRLSCQIKVSPDLDGLRVTVPEEQ
jgi:2Fe-2S ferredoxin